MQTLVLQTLVLRLWFCNCGFGFDFGFATLAFDFVYFGFGFGLCAACNQPRLATAPTLQVPAGASQEPGTTVQAVVLDVNKREGIVELSLQTALVQRAQAASAAAAAEQQQQPKKKQKQKKGAAAAAEAAEQMPQLQEGQQVAARIELVRWEWGRHICAA